MRGETTRAPSKRAANAAALRAAVGDAAVELFVERGFNRTTVDDIAERAGISRRTFFNHFATKEAAAFAEHTDRMRWLSTELDALDEVGIPGVAEVVADGVESFARSEVNRQRYRLLLQIPELREQDMRDDLDYELAIAAVLERHFGSADTGRFEARNAAASIVGAMRSALTTWATAGTDFDPVAAYRVAVGLDA